MRATARKRLPRRIDPALASARDEQRRLAYVVRRLRLALDPGCRRHVADVRFFRLLSARTEA